MDSWGCWRKNSSRPLFLPIFNPTKINCFMMRSWNATCFTHVLHQQKISAKFHPTPHCEGCHVERIRHPPPPQFHTQPSPLYLNFNLEVSLLKLLLPVENLLQRKNL
jgi:hypothetical protein